MNRRPTHIVVVAFHGVEALERCLASLRGQIKVTVVDNSSCRRVRAAAEKIGAEYLDSGTNLGFATGVNVALRRLLVGPPHDVLLLNPDATLGADALELLAAFLQEPGNERVGAVSPRLVGAAGRPQRVLWPFPSPARAWCEAFGLGNLPARRLFAIGAALLLRWEAIVEVGLFDERFFLYAEEADWQWRAAAFNWTSAVCHEAVAAHAGGGTSTDRKLREALFHAGQEIYIRKWYGRIGWSFYRVAAFGGAALRALLLVGERRKGATRRALLYFRGPRRSALAIGDPS